MNTSHAFDEREEKKSSVVIVLYAVTTRLCDNYPFAITLDITLIEILLWIDTSRTLIEFSRRVKQWKEKKSRDKIRTREICANLYFAGSLRGPIYDWSKSHYDFL